MFSPLPRNTVLSFCRRCKKKNPTLWGNTSINSEGKMYLGKAAHLFPPLTHTLYFKGKHVTSLRTLDTPQQPGLSFLNA